MGVLALRIAKDPLEAFSEPFHIRETPRRIDAWFTNPWRKLRILLVASAPSREFSFLRTLLVREAQDKRASLSTFVQNEAGTTGKLTPELDETILLRFPNRFDLANKKIDPADRPYNLNEYDVILAFDPDLDRTLATAGRRSGPLGSRRRRWPHLHRRAD